MDETVTGIRGDVAIKIFGDDLKVLDELGNRTLTVISSIPGAAEPQMEVTSGVAELQIDVDRSTLARYGLNVSDVQEVIENLVGGKPVSEMIQGRARFPISVRLSEELRNDPEALKQLIVRAPNGELVQLGSDSPGPDRSRTGSNFPREHTKAHCHSDQCTWDRSRKLCQIGSAEGEQFYPASGGLRNRVGWPV